MNRGRVIRAIVTMGAVLALSTDIARAADYSGTIVGMDKDAGQVVIGEVGPWRVKDGQTEITKRTIAVAPSARFVAAKRSPGPGPTGWPGEFVDLPLDRWAVRSGDFVTVHVERTETGPMAVRVTVAGE